MVKFQGVKQALVVRGGLGIAHKRIPTGVIGSLDALSLMPGKTFLQRTQTSMLGAHLPSRLVCRKQLPGLVGD